MVSDFAKASHNLQLLDLRDAFCVAGAVMGKCPGDLRRLVAAIANPAPIHASDMSFDECAYNHLMCSPTSERKLKNGQGA